MCCIYVTSVALDWYFEEAREVREEEGVSNLAAWRGNGIAS